jgi:hypothetical protein
LEAYIDDSASDARCDKRLFLAGYIQDEEAWMRLSEDWRSALARSPALNALHMSTCFSGWSEQEREAKIDALVAVLTKYRPPSIECSVSRAAHKALLRPHSPYDLRHPYFVGFIGVLHGVAKTVRAEGLSGPVRLTFDEQGNVGNDAALWFVPLKYSDPSLTEVLGDSPRFANDEEVIPLQVADMLAWYVRRTNEDNCSARQRKVADALRFRHYYLEISDDVFPEWARRFAAVPGVEETKGRRGSVNRTIRAIVAEVPPEQIVPVLTGIENSAARFRLLRKLLVGLGLRKVWRWLSKKTFRLR